MSGLSTYSLPKIYKILPILLLAFLLRMNGLGFGLPYVFHDDEHQYVGAGVAFLQDREAMLAGLQKLNNPPLFKSGLGLLYLSYSHLLLRDPQAITAALDSEQWRTFFHYGGRLANVSVGLLTVALLYALGRRLYSYQTALLGAFLLAVSFLHVRESHFAVNDAPLAFLAVAALYTAAGILRRGRWFDYLATGLLIGLAGATKYTGVYLGSLLLLAHWLRYPGRSRSPGSKGEPAALQPDKNGPAHSIRSPLGWLLSPRWLAGLALVPVGFVVGAPVVVTAWPEMLRRMGRLAEYGRFGYHDLLLAPQGSWIFYLTTLAWGTGFLMLGALLVAVLAALIHRSHRDLLLVAFPLLLYVMMSQQKMVFARFILPALPPLVLLVAVWLERLSRRLSRSGDSKLAVPTPPEAVPGPSGSPSPRRPGRGSRLSQRTMLLTAAILLSLQPLVWSIWFGVVLSRPDSRQRAAAWIEANIPPGAVIYAETHAIPRESVLGSVRWPQVEAEDVPFDTPDLLSYYQERGVQFILTSDFHHERIFTDRQKETGRQAWVAGLAGLKPVREFQPYWLPGRRFVFDQRYGPWQETLLRHQPGPIIRVYALEPPPNRRHLDPFVEANQLADRAALYAYELSPDRDALPGQGVAVSIYWLNRGWRESDELVVSLLDAAGFEAARTTAQPAPGFEEELRLGHKMIKSEAQLPLPPGTPPGAYRMRFSLFDRNKLQTLASVEPGGLTVTGPAAALRASDGPQAPGLALAPGLSLTGSELAVRDSAMQNTLAFDQDNWLVLSWWADRDIETDYRVRLALLDAQQKAIAAWEGQPVHNSYPTSNWQAGQSVRDPWNLRLPDTLGDQALDVEDTAYDLVLTLHNPEGGVVGSESLGALRISGRARSSALPAMQQSVEAVWAEAFSLLGFNIRAIPNSSDSGWLELDLFWQSLAPVETDYLVGLRLVDTRGQTVLAQDGQPRGGQAPTSTWQPGEVVHDFHSLRYEKLALGEQYRLELLLIDPHTGETLTAANNGQLTDSLLLTAWP